MFLRCWMLPRHLKQPLTMMASRVQRASHSSILIVCMCVCVCVCVCAGQTVYKLVYKQFTNWANSLQAGRMVYKLAERLASRTNGLQAGLSTIHEFFLDVAKPPRRQTHGNFCHASLSTWEFCASVRISWVRTYVMFSEFWSRLATSDNNIVLHICRCITCMGLLN